MTNKNLSKKRIAFCTLLLIGLLATFLSSIQPNGFVKAEKSLTTQQKPILAVAWSSIQWSWPKIQWPSFQWNWPKIPDFKQPSFTTPSIPKIPSYQPPSTPNFQTPQIPKIPDIPPPRIAPIQPIKPINPMPIIPPWP
jgi:hypothetical protein